MKLELTPRERRTVLQLLEKRWNELDGARNVLEYGTRSYAEAMVMQESMTDVMTKFRVWSGWCSSVEHRDDLAEMASVEGWNEGDRV